MGELTVKARKSSCSPVGNRERGSMVRSRSLDGETLDLRKQLQLIEQEASILRNQVTDLEEQNDKLTNDNKTYEERLAKESGSAKGGEVSKVMESELKETKEK